MTCHQDSTFLYTDPLEIAGLWFALEDATIENGCLWAIPGEHRRGLKSRWIRSPSGGMKFEVYDHEPWPENELVPLEVLKGSLFSCMDCYPIAASKTDQSVLAMRTRFTSSMLKQNIPRITGYSDPQPCPREVLNSSFQDAD